MVKCPRCGYDNPDYAMYCIRCGYLLTQQQPYTQPYVPPQPINAANPYIPARQNTVKLDDIYLSYSRKLREEIASKRKAGYIVEAIGIVAIFMFILLGIVEYLPASVLSTIGVLMIKIGDGIVSNNSVPKNSISVGKIPKFGGELFSFNSKGVYGGKRLLARWKDVADIQVVEKNDATGMGSIKVILRRALIKEIIVTEVLHPDRLVEYLKKTYLNPNLQGFPP